MSTILEALRRAEAERERPQGEPLALSAAPAASPVGAGWWVLLGLLLAAAAAALLWFFGPKPAPVPAPAVVVAPAPAPPAPAPVASAPLPAPPALLQQAPARTLPASAPPARLPRLAELSPALRAQLPPLQVGGSMHSADAQLRSLILNGQLYREGDAIAPHLKLESIGPRSAVLRLGEQRFEISY